jgi:hypothetical protein
MCVLWQVTCGDSLGATYWMWQFHIQARTSWTSRRRWFNRWVQVTTQCHWSVMSAWEALQILAVRWENSWGILSYGIARKWQVAFEMIHCHISCIARTVRIFHDHKFIIINITYHKDYIHTSIYVHVHPNIVRVIKSRSMRWAGHVARMGERRVCRVLMGKPNGKRPLGRPRCRWEDNIKMDLQEVGCGSIDWTELAQDRDRWRALWMR